MEKILRLSFYFRKNISTKLFNKTTRSLIITNKRYCIIVYVSHFWLPNFYLISVRSLIYAKITLFLWWYFHLYYTVVETYMGGYP